jgi:hypothetical protein
MADDIINIGGPAPYEKREESPFSSDSTKSLSKPQLEQAAQSDALTQDQIKGTAGRAAYDTGVATIQAQDAAATSRIKNENVLARSAVDEAQAAKVAAAADTLRQANDEYRAAPPPSLFADTKGWDKARRAIAISVAGLGEAISARANATLGRANGPSAVASIIQMDLDRQREIIGRLKDNQIMAKEGVKDAQQARELALAKVDLKGAAMLNLAAAHTEELLKAKGVELPAIQQNEQVLLLRRQEQERKQAAVAGLASEHTRTGAKTETTNRTVPDTSSNARIGVVRNPDGTAAGTSPASEAKDANDQTTLRVNADDALKDLLEHVEEHGRVAYGSDAWKERNSLFAKAKIAVGSVSALGKSDESLKTEMETLGPRGDGAWAPDAGIIKHVIKRNETNAKTAIQMHTAHPGAVGDDGLPVKPASNPTPAAPSATPVTPPMVPPAAPATPPMVPPAARQPARSPGAPFTQDQKDAVKWIAAHPGDPRVPDIRKRLGL